MKTLEVDLRLPLDSFDLAVEFRAEKPMTGVFGPSGAGKSSLLEAIAGLRRDATGSISLGDTVWLDSAGRIALAPERRGIGYVPQDGLLFPHLDVRRNLLAGAQRASGRHEDRLRSMAELLGLTPLLERSVTSLSGGERQRVALGRALCSGPSLLLLDEPLAALDLPLRRRLLPLLRRLRAELTVPMLFISHDPIEIQALCDEVLVLSDGRIVASGPPARVLNDPGIRPLAQPDEPPGYAGYSNVLSGVVVASTADSARVRLGTHGPELTVGPNAATPGEVVLLELPADRILIATEAPRGLSARNALPAEVRQIQSGVGVTLVHALVKPGATRVVVEVTESTPARLGLEPGREIFLVVKATSCRVHGEQVTASR